MNGIFTAVCPACAGRLEPAPEPEGTSTGLNVCTACGRMYLVHVGYAIPVRPAEHLEV
jgi:uncharacterized protein YbaR (Trm112 family)